tara:strand:+ start:383 stop:829 length:447 start_codon:yes stop_codon:yes gene_type:complete
MPYTKEERKEYYRLWRIKNKEEKKEYMRLWNIKNRQRTKKKQRLWYLNNKEKMEEKHKEWRQSEQGIKSRTISSWRRQGILCFDFDLLYDIFLSTSKCEFCQVELTTGGKNTSTTKCLDHNHDINDMFNVRGVLCLSCNNKDVLNILK